MAKRVTRTKHIPQESIEPCKYCNGKGLCGYWARNGYRVPVGDRLAKTSNETIPCNKCNRP